MYSASSFSVARPPNMSSGRLGENVVLPLVEWTHLPASAIRPRAFVTNGDRARVTTGIVDAMLHMHG
jgi:hypothetical protein